MNYIIFEDENFASLSPFILTHSVFEVRCGIYTNLERIEQLIKSDDNLILLVREELVEITKIKYPAYEVNPKVIPEGIFLNSSCIWDSKLISQFSNGRSYMYNNKLVASCNEKEIKRDEVGDYLKHSMKVTKDIEVKYINYLWDSIFLSHNQIAIDFTELSSGKLGSIHPSAVLESDENINLGQGSYISAGVILDGSNGPIIIGKETVIDIGAMIKGPVFIGSKCVINPGAKLRGNIVLGPVCKIGGELEDSIIQGFSNKQHDGFLGHSYLGEWVNLGANTNNSNLKNNYSDIRIMLNNKLIDTHKKFLGVIMGDYSRTGISTMFNTGTYVGVGANIFGSEFQSKHIKSFRWGKSDTTNFEKLIETCRIMKSRRNLKFEECEENLLRLLYEKESEK